MRAVFLAFICLLHAAAAVQSSRADTSATAEVGNEDAPSSPSVRTTKRELERFLRLHNQILARARQGNIDLLFLGDSITEYWTTAPAVWNQYFGKYNPATFGVAGDRTQQVLWRITNGELDGIKPKVVVLMIGTNNSNSDSAASIEKAIGKIVGIIRDKLPESRILLLGIFPREPRKEGGPNPQMDVIRKVNPGIAKLADGKMVRYLDISDKFLVNGRIPKGIMPDGLHLTEKGYEIWAKAIAPALDEMMK